MSLPKGSATLTDIWSSASLEARTRVNQPTSGWRFVDFDEIWRYRDLYYFLVRRSIKVRYVQSVLGVGWAVLQPFLTMIVFTVIFGRLAKIDSDGVPYAIFTYTALVPWTYFSRSLTDATGSLTGNISLLNKVYVPRLIMPLASVTSKLVDFAIALSLVFGLMVWFRIAPTPWMVLLPLLVLLMFLTTLGMGAWLSTLAVQYRDVRYGLQFGIQLLMYAAPVVYPVSLVPGQFRLLYALNPMVGVIEGFRAALLGTNPMPWDLLVVGTVTSSIIGVGGIFYFRRMERIFADVA